MYRILFIDHRICIVIYDIAWGPPQGGQGGHAPPPQKVLGWQ